MELRFTKLELQIIELICEGNSAKEIGVKLGRTTRCIENHNYILKMKTNVRTSAALVYKLMKEEIIK